MAGCAIGLYADMAETAAQFAIPGKRIEVRPQFHDQYQEYTSLYRQVFDQLRRVYERLKDLSDTS